MAQLSVEILEPIYVVLQNRAADPTSTVAIEAAVSALASKDAAKDSEDASALSAAAALASEQAAKSSEDTAKVSEDAAKASEDAAALSASGASDAKDAAVVAQGVAEQAKTDAETAANTATTKAGEASVSEQAAAASAMEASGYKDDASASALEAAGYKDEAAASAVEAAATVAEMITAEELQSLYPLVPYTRRVAADSGTIRHKGVAKRILDWFYEADLYSNMKLMAFPEIGAKVRVSGIYNYLTKLYSGEFTPVDLIQTTEASQPYRGGDIAPTERYCAKNPSGDTRKFTHDAIVVSGTYTLIKIQNLVTNGKIVTSYTEVTSGTLSEITWTGKLYGYIVLASTMSTADRTAFSALMSSIFPSIEYVTIGTQQWATSNCELTTTPMGNVIPEMQAASATEKITNSADRDFSSDTGFWDKGAGWTIGSGVLIANVTGYTDTRWKLTTKPTTWYKIVTTVVVSSGVVRINIGSSSKYLDINTSGTYTKYIKSINTGVFSFTAYGSGGTFVGSIDNVSVQELGWADSQQLYDGLIAQGYTAANAAKECGWWCHYNNDAANGAIYGKLYNWFAVKTLQNDIDAYNAANPTARWGWHVPSSTEFATLSAYLGGDAVSGGKLKMTGMNYWDSPNTVADNSSGLTILGTGYRDQTGNFASIKVSCSIPGIDLYRAVCLSTTGALTITNTPFTIAGYPLRLLKD